MGGLGRRLERLEERAGGMIEDDFEERVRSETARRTSTEDLRILCACIERMLEEGGGPTEEEEPTILRYMELREEVRGELGAPSQ